MFLSPLRHRSFASARSATCPTGRLDAVAAFHNVAAFAAMQKDYREVRDAKD